MDELAIAVQDVMLRYPDIDWTMAAQSVAVSRSLDEQDVLEAVRPHYEKK